MTSGEVNPEITSASENPEKTGNVVLSLVSQGGDSVSHIISTSSGNPIDTNTFKAQRTKGILNRKNEEKSNWFTRSSSFVSIDSFVLDWGGRYR